MMKRILFLVFLLGPVIVGGQVITTVAGGATGHGGYWGDGGPATAAEMNFFAGLALDSHDNIYISDGHRIRKVNASTGIITTIAGTGIPGYNGDGIPATTALLRTPVCISFDSIDNLYVYDAGNHRIRKIDVVTGIISTHAGNGTFGFTGDGGPATAATIDGGDMAWDAHGNLYYGSTRKIRKISPSGIITTHIGTGLAGATGDGVPVTSTCLAPARGLAIDTRGNMYLADSTYAVRKINGVTGIITRIAGTGDNMFTPYSGDGIPGNTCHINPFDISVDDTGNVYIADYGNNRIEKVDTFGIIYTIAGSGISGFSGDGGLATAAKISFPENVVLDKCNNVYIADFNNKRVRKVTYHPSCDPTLVINHLENSTSISIYPNPTNELLQIENVATQTKYRLLNLVGSCVQLGVLKQGSNSVFVRSLPAGMYLLVVTDEEGRRVVRKIVKE